MAAKLVSRNNIRRITFEEPDYDDEGGDDEGDNECLQELQPLIDAINRLQETCDTPLQCVQTPEQPEESFEENVVENFSHKIETQNVGSDRWCADCSKARRVEDMRSLQRGQHIALPGEHSSYYLKSLGKRISAYRHHAIAKEIVHRSRQTAEVILIHFYKEDKVIKVREQTRTFNLQYDELYIIEYQYPRYDPDTIVQRAESILEQSENGELFKSYNFITKNCEHFAIWCVLGEKKSLQAHKFLNNIRQMLLNIFGGGSKIAQILLNGLVAFFSKIPSFLTKVITDSPFGLGVTAVVYLIYCIIKTVYLIKQYRNDKTICWHCLKEKLLDLWLQFGSFSVTSVLTFVIINFALPLLWLMINPISFLVVLLAIFANVSIVFPLQIPLTFVLVLGGTFLNWAVPRIRKALWSPVQYSQNQIKTLSEIKVGDVVSLTYYGLSHLVVVSKVKWDNNPKQGTVQGIHYSLPGLFGTREISEEDFPVDLTSSKVNIVEFNALNTYSPKEVVERARKRIGERKWKMSSNRSDHLCRWAKVKSSDYNSEEIDWLDDEDTEHMQSGSLSSLLVGKDDVHLMNEIQPGDVVEYRSYKGIVIKLKDIKDGREFYMHTVTRKSCLDYYGEKVKETIDLNKNDLKIHRYHPVHCVSRSKRVEKAIGMIGKKIQSWTLTGFVEDIILKQRENN